MVLSKLMQAHYLPLSFSSFSPPRKPFPPSERRFVLGPADLGDDEIPRIRLVSSDSPPDSEGEAGDGLVIITKKYQF